jgi:hypothetical protein
MQYVYADQVMRCVDTYIISTDDWLGDNFQLCSQVTTGPVREFW